MAASATIRGWSSWAARIGVTPRVSTSRCPSAARESSSATRAGRTPPRPGAATPRPAATPRGPAATAGASAGRGRTPRERQKSQGPSLQHPLRPSARRLPPEADRGVQASGPLGVEPGVSVVWSTSLDRKSGGPRLDQRHGSRRTRVRDAWPAPVEPDSAGLTTPPMATRGGRRALSVRLRPATSCRHDLPHAATIPRGLRPTPASRASLVPRSAPSRQRPGHPVRVEASNIPAQSPRRRGRGYRARRSPPPRQPQRSSRCSRVS